MISIISAKINNSGGDEMYGRGRRGRRVIIRELMGHRNTCELANMTFAPLPQEHKKALEKHWQESFELWWDTWILPKLQELMDKEITNSNN